jgi:hypothetical protein
MVPAAGVDAVAPGPPLGVSATSYWLRRAEIGSGSDFWQPMSHGRLQATMTNEKIHPLKRGPEVTGSMFHFLWFDLKLTLVATCH